MATPRVTGAPVGDTLMERLTASFYAWEARGRGWTEWPDRVLLEPPFVPFPGHLVVGPPLPDDARRPTALSTLLERLLGRDPPLPAPELPEELELPWARPDEDRSPCGELLLFVPPETRVTAEASAQFLLSLRGAHLPVALEIVGTHETLAIQLVARDPDLSLVESQLQSLFPEATSTRSLGSLEYAWRAGGPETAIVEFGLSREFMLPLARANRLDPDPLSPILGALSDLASGECGVLQVLFEPVREAWAESVLRAVTDGRGGPFFLDAPDLTKLAADKVSHPLYAVVIRLGVRSTSGRGLRRLARSVAGALAQFGTPRGNELIPLAGELPEWLIERDLLERRSHRTGMLVSSQELVSFVHPPSPAVRVPKLAREAPRTKAAPREVMDEGVAVGENRHRGDTATVRLPLPARLRHTHLVGASGTGKTTLMIELILQDIEAGRGLACLDPHGDLVEEILARTEETHAERLVVIDPADEEYVVGFNPLQAHSDAERQLLASDLVGVFRRLSTSWGDQMHSVFANAILAFLESDRGGTLLDLRRFLVERSFRETFLETVSDSEVRYFWRHEFPLLAGRPQAPILTRLDAFLRPKVLRAMIATRESRLDLHQVVEERYVVLVKLAQGMIGEENAALLGSFFVSKLHQVALARQILSPEAREPFFLYLDEFQEFVTPSLASLLSGARKFGVGLVLAHQSLGQVKARSPEVLDAVLSNAYTQISFRVGEADARTLERGLSFFDAGDLQSLGVGEAIVRVGRADQDFTVSVPPLPVIAPKEADRRKEDHRSASRSRYAVKRDEGEPRTERATQSREPRPPAESDTSSPVTSAQPAATPSVPEENRSRRTRRAAAAYELDKAALDYLHSVAAEPFLAVRERNRALGLSAWKGQRMKNLLVRAELAREVPINPGGRGRTFKLLELTEAGRTILSEYKIAPSAGHGRGGIAHQWWVRTIASWLEEREFVPAIEDASSGARVDLAFSARGETTAVEIEMSEGHAVENIRKDLAAGFGRVVCLVDDPAALDRVRKKLATDLEDAPSQVHTGTLRDFEAILGPLVGLFQASSPSRRPNQNQEPRNVRRQAATILLPSTPPSKPPGYRVLEPGVLSTPAAAEYLTLSPATLETLRSRGGGPPFTKLGRRVVYRREDLDAWLAERRRNSTSDEGKDS